MYNRGIERCHAGSSSLLRAKREPEMVLALAARGQSAFALGLSSLLRAKREPEKHPLLSRRGRHEKGAARPFQTPKGLSKRKKASRCAKTGCGSQRLLRCRSHPAGRGPNNSSLFPPLAAVVAVALFSRFSDLLLRSWCYLSADGKVLLKPEIFGEAVNGRSTKKCV